MKTLDEQFKEAVRDNRKIDAIKAYRLLHGCGLKEAYDYVEANWAELRRK